MITLQTKQYNDTKTQKTTKKLLLDLAVTEVICWTHKRSPWSCLSSQLLGYGTDKIKLLQSR